MKKISDEDINVGFDGINEGIFPLSFYIFQDFYFTNFQPY
jgi:hypothetical protein